MRRRLLAAAVPVMLILIVGSSQVQTAEAQSSAESEPEQIHTLLSRYCVSCHNDRTQTAGLSLEGMDLADVAADAEVWEKVIKKLRAGMMPPPGRPRPQAAAYDQLSSFFEDNIDRVATANPNPGRGDALRRLNGTEYQNAIRDLLDLEVDVRELLPADDSSAGFDNVALGGLDPGRLEQYLSAARKISRLAVGSPVTSAVADTFIVPSDLNQQGHIEGLPFGTRGGAAFLYNFPVDAEYDLRAEMGKSWNSNRVGGLREPHDVVITLDGQPVKVFTMAPPPPPNMEPDQGFYQPDERPADADLVVRVPVTAGPHMVGATFVDKGLALNENRREPFLKVHVTVGEDQRTQPNLYSVTVIGPFDQMGPGDTPSRRRIFTCEPARSVAADETACATEILSTIARRAYRRPVSDADLDVLLGFFEEGRTDGGFEAGIEMALRRILVSPEFLFRVERDPEHVAPGESYRISDLELASRLSFFLWSSIPDDELLDVASRGELRDPAGLERQVRRMLADPRASTLVTNFAAQWLYLRNIPSVSPDANVFPDFDETLRRALQRETELFFESIIREDRSALDLLQADYSFINERLAKHYGIPNVYGSHFRRVTFDESTPRRGLLGQGSIMAVTAYATRTSPVVRGKWVLENLLGTPPPPPPPNVPPLAEDSEAQILSMRERMEQHRKNPVCASCHSIMDPVGLSLENFDAIGRWRTETDTFEPLDVEGSFPDGTTFEGVSGLNHALLQRGEQFLSTLTEKLLTYGLGRQVEHYDAPSIRTVVRQAADNDYRFSSLILGIVNSTPFQMRRAPGDAELTAAEQQ